MTGEDTTMNLNDAEIERDPTLTPEGRAKQGAAGTPVTLGDGRTWLLCDGAY